MRKATTMALERDRISFPLVGAVPRPHYGGRVGVCKPCLSGSEGRAGRQDRAPPCPRPPTTCGGGGTSGDVIPTARVVPSVHHDQTPNVNAHVRSVASARRLSLDAARSELPRWGSRVRIPSSAPGRCCLEARRADVPEPTNRRRAISLRVAARSNAASIASAAVRSASSYSSACTTSTLSL
jgi:hypothetical protein